MAKKIYVGNLSYSVDDSSLHAKFAQFGSVDSARVITDRDTGRSKGFGFVEMPSDDEADKAINNLNGSDFEGRAMNCAEARPQEDRPRGGGGGGGGPRRPGGPRPGGPRGGGFGGGGGGGGGRSGGGGFGGGGRY